MSLDLILDELLNRIAALAPPIQTIPIPDINQSIENLSQRIQALSTIDRETPLTDLPEASDLPQMGHPNSSNILQYVYYPAQESIIITFSNLKDYQYWLVSQEEFEKIIAGDATAVTKGHNQFGTWYIGKNPSVGAAVYRFLVQAGKPWKRL